MKSTVAILGAMAAVASAYSPAQHLHFPRANSTTTAPAASDLTTLTVKTTETKTIISCAPTVTNCPADETGMSTIPESDRTTQTVTNTVELTKTVCPVTDVERISSEVMSQHATPTQAPPAGMTTKVIDVVNDMTVTMTLGAGSTKSIVPTVIKSTIKSTVTVPCETTDVKTGDSEPTTTTTATSTSTRTVTVSRSKPTETAPAESTADSTAETCDQAPASTVTVTVAQTTITVPASTVYVTAPCDATKTGSGDAPAVTGKAGDGNDNKVDTDDKHNNGGNNDDNQGEDNKPVETTTVDCPPDEIITMQSTVTVIPVPTGGSNSTGIAGPSGFARLRR
jgi:hypothetical protein